MNERRFTFLDGPDAGATFVLGDTPLTLGRDTTRDVVLRDDRASRLHARIFADGDRVFIRDENSSNGTLVNGVSVVEQLLREGDVIQIGANHIVYGAPEQAALESTVTAAAPRKRVTGGELTEVLRPPKPEIVITPVEMSLSQLLDGVSSGAQEGGGGIGTVISVESSLKPDTVALDPEHLRPALVGLLSECRRVMGIELQKTRTVRSHVRLVLRGGHEPVTGGFLIEIICAGLPVFADQITAQIDPEVVQRIRAVGAAHEGVLEFAPTDSKDVLARLRLPPDLGRSTQATIVR